MRLALFFLHHFCSFNPLAHALAFRNPTILLDREGRCFSFRTSSIDFVANHAQDFWDATHKVLEPTLESGSQEAKFEDAIRGWHAACIMGHMRQFSAKPMMTEWHSQNLDLVEEFLNTPIIMRLVSAKSSNFAASVQI